jgi:hypothetical protein
MLRSDVPEFTIYQGLAWICPSKIHVLKLYCQWDSSKRWGVDGVVKS